MKFFYIIYLFSPIFVFSQNYSIKGKIQDSNKNPLELISINLLKNDSIYYSEVTNTQGEFLFKNINGEFELEVINFNIPSFAKKILVDHDLDLGTINIENTINLNEATLSVKKTLIEKKVDRLIFNVENSISATGGDALDALKITPGLIVQNDNISMIGKSSVSVMIDDKLIQLSGNDLSNFLKSISSDDIKNIEVITTPPSKYEAEGNSGIVNIKLKKIKENSWKNIVRTSYIQTTYPSHSIGNTFNYRKNKISISTSIDGKLGDEATKEKFTINYPDQQWENSGNRKNQQDFLSGRFNTDYQVSEKSNIGLILMYNKSKPNSLENSKVDVYDNHSLVNNIVTTGNTSETNKNTSLNIHYDYILDSLGKKLSINADYFNFKENKIRAFNTKKINLSNYSILDQLIADNSGNLDIKNYSIKVDFEYPTKFIDINYGGKIAFTKTNSDILFIDKTSGFEVIDSLQTNNFNYKENTQSLYIDFSKKIGEKWQTKFGLRYENTQTEGISINNKEKNTISYEKLFPSAYISYTVNDKNFLNLNYSRRISRPAFWELNPFRWYNNANSYSEGNPFLKPAFNDNFELTYGYKQKWFTVIFSQIRTNGFSQVPMVDNQTYQQVFTRANYFKSYAYGIVQSYSFNKLKWLESNFQANAHYTKTEIYKEYQSFIPAQNGLGFSLSINNGLTLNKTKTILGEINYSYTAPNKGMIYKQSSSMSLDIGVKILLLNKNFQFAINAYDILKTANPDFTTFTNNTKQKYNIYSDTQYLRFSIRYNFGNNKINVKSRDFGNNDEKNRIK